MKCQMMRTIWLSLQVAAVAAAITLVPARLLAGGHTGRDAIGFSETMGLVEGADLSYSCQYMTSTAKGNVLWPDEQAEFTFQLVNNSEKPLHGQGKVDVIPYVATADPGDNWAQKMLRVGAATSVGFDVNVAPKKFQNVTVKPAIPAQLGGYGLVVDLGAGGRSFITSVARTFKPAPMTIRFPQITSDVTEVEVLSRLGVCPNRVAFGYHVTTEPGFDNWFGKMCGKLEDYKQARLPITVEFGVGGSIASQPLGRPRPLLDENGVVKPPRADGAWMPSYDPDFKKMVKMVLEKYGWPRGTVIAVKFMNEPWDGSSISGWGADTPRYREIFRTMCEATDEAEKEYGVDVLTGGCDSTANTFDKLFADGSTDFLKHLDFCSIHYQGLNSSATYKPWLQRTGPHGRVQIWDTESWVANGDDKVSATVAADLAAGYDHVVGVIHKAICTRNARATIIGDDGKKVAAASLDTWSTAAALGATQHFIGQRKFNEILFKNGLPWVMVFDGEADASGKSDAEDGTVVVVGDLAPELGRENLLFRNVGGLKPTSDPTVAALKAKLAALPANAPKEDRAELTRTLTRAAKYVAISGASMTLADAQDRFQLHDIYGNAVPTENGKTVIPLDGRGLFLRGDGKAGSFAALLDAIRNSRVEGIEPLARKCHDMTSPVDQGGSTCRLELTNILNRPVKGTLSLRVEGLKAEPALQEVTFSANETKVFPIGVSGTARPDNTYHLTMLFDAGADGQSAHEEDLHVNQIARKHIQVDGNLDDWQGVLPQTIKVEAATGPSFTEEALAMGTTEAGGANGFAQGYLAYDEKYFYFAARVADSTPDGGTFRFETIDEDQFFYPQVSKAPKPRKQGGTGELEELTWPPGVRRYTYRMRPTPPWAGDSVQIAFNVIDAPQKDWLSNPPGTMFGYTTYKDTDYEYCLNKVADKFGGGTEIWRDNVPGMPPKHFTPRQGKSALDGPAKDGKLVVVQGPATRIVECAIPWTEIPEVKKRCDAGETIKFGFRVNDNKGNSGMELARERSVSKLNHMTFRPDYAEHWSNEIEFAFEK